MGKFLAIDFGLKRSGIAITDENKIIASGLTTVNSKDLMAFLVKLTESEILEIIVLGEPKRLNNEPSHITANVHLLKLALEKQFPFIPIKLVDERFTSKMAFQSMIDNGMTKKQRQNKGLIDEISATIILQSYMASLTNFPPF
jgi:putative holliday junction resolvase